MSSIVKEKLKSIIIPFYELDNVSIILNNNMINWEYDLNTQGIIYVSEGSYQKVKDLLNENKIVNV